MKEEGLLKDLQRTYRYSFYNYNENAHKNYDYQLWEKDYTYWDPKCTRDGMGPKKFEILSNQAASIGTMMGALCIMTFFAMCCSCCTSMFSAEKQEEENFHGPVTFGKNLFNVFICLSVNIVAWLAYS